MKTYKLLKEIGDGVKTPQVKVILQTLADNVSVGGNIAYQELIKLVDNNEAFVSRQGAQRVVKFYEKAMIEEGYLQVEGTDRVEPQSNRKTKITKSEAGASEGGEEKPKRKASQRKKGEVAASADSEDAGTADKEPAEKHHGHAGHAAA